MFDLMFTEEWWWGEGYGPDGPFPDKSDEPTTFFQALYSLDEGEIEELRETFEADPFETTDSFLLSLMDRAREINSCDTLAPPIKVYLTEDGAEYLTVH
jgi:hypothetical protein